MTGTSVTLQYSQIYEKDAEKSCVLRFDLNICKVLDDVTSDYRLFHVLLRLPGKLGCQAYRAMWMVQPALRSKMNAYVCVCFLCAVHLESR